MKFTINNAEKDPNNVELESGDWFLDVDGDLNLVLEGGGVVCFSVGSSPRRRILSVGKIQEIGDIRRILRSGETITFKVP